ncbi:MAG: glycosyltransferase family 4 protein, partial [Beijerinckiaceae bacterium]
MSSPQVEIAAVANEKMRMAVVCAESIADGYAPFSHIHGLTQALDRRGYSTTIIAKDSGSYHESSILSRLMRYAAINWQAIRATRHSDIMLARGHFAHLPWVIIASLRRVPVIHEMNGMLFDAATTHRWLSFAQGIISLSYRWQFALSHGITCVTAEIAANVRSLKGKAPITIISNGVDLSTFYPSAASTATSTPARRFAIFLSALAPWHGINTLLNAVAHPDWPADLDLVIVGDGAQSAVVRQHAAKDKRIRYMGLLPHKELSSLVRRATIGLSLVESLAERGLTEVYPLKLFEMMASGVPVIGTDVPGQREIIIKAKAGMLVPPQNAVALAKAVAALHANPERRTIGLAGVEAVKTGYSWAQRAEELDAFIRQNVFG